MEQTNRLRNIWVIAVALGIQSLVASDAWVQEFRREIDTIPVFVDGILIAQPFAGALHGFSMPTFADIDNDGDPDLFVGEDTGNINFFRNVGTASDPVFFLETESFAAISNSGTVLRYKIAPTFADIDSDGDFDLFVGGDRGKVAFYRNTGTSTNPAFLLETENFVAVGSVSAPTFADIDKDGDLDLFVSDDFSRIAFFRNTGTPTNPAFELVEPRFVGTAFFGRATRPTFIDIEGDGDLDLLIGEEDGNLNFFRNTGTPTNHDFVLETENFAEFLAGSHSAPSFADIDNDGDDDLFVGERAGNISFYRNQGTVGNPDFEFAAPHLTAIDVRSSIPMLADIDGDGDLDLFVAWQKKFKESGGIYLYRNTGSASHPAFSFEGNILEVETWDAPLGPELADIDGDGDLDLFVGTQAGPILLFRNTGSATEPVFTLETEKFAGIEIGSRSCCSHPRFADLDDDGDLDLLLAAGSADFSFYRNMGTATEPTLVLEAGTFSSVQPSLPTFADIDADGDLDLFGGSSDGTIVLYRNLGTAAQPEFALETELFGSVIVSGAALAFADIDNDGDLDFFAGGGTGGLSFYRQVMPSGSPLVALSGIWQGTETIRQIGNCTINGASTSSQEYRLALAVNDIGNIVIQDLIFRDLKWTGKVEADRSVHLTREFGVNCDSGLNQVSASYSGTIEEVEGTFRLMIQATEEWCPAPQSCIFMVTYDLTKENVTSIESPFTDGVPIDFFLAQNYPNPFNPETEIRFHLPSHKRITIKIYNIVGEEIRTLVDQEYNAGTFRVRWHGKNNLGNLVSSGVYFYQLRAGDFSTVRKMMLLR